MFDPACSTLVLPLVVGTTEEGLVSGYDNGDGTYTLNPGETVARERFATIVSRAYTDGLMK